MAVALLAEVNRAPFDMPEAEQELTAGYHSEYSGMKFAMFYLAEYIGMIAVSAIGAALYFGGYHFFLVDKAPLLGPVVFGLKVVVLLIVMIWVRGTLPRIRYDRLMAFGWKVMLPLALIAVAWTAVAVVLEETYGSQVTVIMAVIAWVLFLAGAAYWLERVGRKPEQVGAKRVEVVSLSGDAGMGLLTMHAVDKMLGVPVALSRAVSSKEGAKNPGPVSGEGKRRE
jgi:hypothetical protein